MLLTELSTGAALMFSVVALIFAVIAYRGSRKSIENALSLAQWTRENNAKSASLKRVAELSAEMTDLKDAYDSLLKQHKKLRSRIGMRENRARASNGEAGTTELGSITDKNELRLRAKALGILK